MEPDDLHEMVTFLKQEFEAGRVKISSRRTLEALLRVRLGPNGRIDPSTVDTSVRALARAVMGIVIHRTLREVPLRQVQSEYFEILEDNFGRLFSEARRYKVSAQRISEDASERPSLVSAFCADVDEFAAGLEEFWNAYGPVVAVHLNDLTSLKSVFGGDIFPSYTSNIACSVGLYMDTIVLPDPLSRLFTMRAALSPKEVFRLAVKHALNALGYRELALAELNPPIVVIAPDRFGPDKGYTLTVKTAGEADALTHASSIFGRTFNDAADLIEFATRSGNPDQIVRLMADPSRLLFDTDWSGPLPDQLSRFLAESQATSRLALTYGEALYMSFGGRMMMANDTLLRSAWCRGSPLIDAPTSWKYLQWKYEYDAAAGQGSKPAPETIISKALGSSLLSGLPSETIIELRRNGATAELRELIGKGIDEINSASDAEATFVADEVIANIDEAFSNHDETLRDLTSSKRKFYGLDVGRYVVSGGLGLASLLTKSPTLGVLTFLSQLGGTLAPDELARRYREMRSKSESLQRSPVGMMFHHLKGKFGFS